MNRDGAPTDFSVAITLRLVSRNARAELPTPTPPTISAVSPTSVRNCEKRSILRASEGAALSRDWMRQPLSGNLVLISSMNRASPAGEASVRRTAIRLVTSEPGRTSPARSSPSFVIITRGPKTVPSESRSGSAEMAPMSLNCASPMASVSPVLTESRSISSGSAQMPSAPACAMTIGPASLSSTPCSG